MTRCLLMLLLTALVQPARACICDVKTLAENVRQVDEVFVGYPVEDAFGGPVAIITTRWWKGSREPRVVVGGMGDCSAPFEKGRPHLVLAFQDPLGDGLATSYCVGTGLLTDSTETEPEWIGADTSGLGPSFPPLFAMAESERLPVDEARVLRRPVLVDWRLVGGAVLSCLAALVVGYIVGKRRT